MNSKPRTSRSAKAEGLERRLDTAAVVVDDDESRWDESVGEPAAREAESRYNRLEKDFRAIDEAARHRPSPWWDEEGPEIKRNLSFLRDQFAQLRTSAPDVWTHMEDAVGASLARLEHSYERAGQEFQIESQDNKELARKADEERAPASATREQKSK